MNTTNNYDDAYPLWDGTDYTNNAIEDKPVVKKNNVGIWLGRITALIAAWLLFICWGTYVLLSKG